MNRPARVGVVGCGIIGKRYVADSPAFESFEVVACADADRACAETLAAEHGLETAPVDELLADPQVDVVLNLTPPAAHAAIVGEALARGKHVYTEKPLASSLPEARRLVDDADRLGLRLGCAPDTFLGSAYRAAAEEIAAGSIGEPVSAVAAMLVGGPESWHPNADFFYRAGGGPMLDMAPYYLTAIASLLGPFAEVAGFAATPTPERTLAVGPRAGERFSAEVPTHVVAALRLRRGALATLVASFEARGQYVSDLVVHGTEGMLALPDPNAFLGPLRIRRGRGDWSELDYAHDGARETRGIGLDEMVTAIAAGRAHRASGALALHVLETASAALAAAEDGRVVPVASEVAAPA